ncbi:MAG: GxxExxY protein [Candidatus Neomarinimicrobiota bacterium]|nr:MAG: GxxExxY protein [Candidatus Neomarinimicrobiota bacterium]
MGLAIEGYNNIGQGFLEAVYQEAFEIELQENDIDYKREKKLGISYKKKILHTFYKADFVCMNKIIIELKSIKKITNIGEVQVINYLKALGINKGLIFNFGAPSLEFKRYIN